MQWQLWGCSSRSSKWGCCDNSPSWEEKEQLLGVLGGSGAGRGALSGEGGNLKREERRRTE